MDFSAPHESRLLPIVRHALEVRDIDHEVEDDPLHVTFSLAGERSSYDFLVSVDERNQIVVCYARADGGVPAERRTAACELLTRINYELALGCFERDLSDGEILFRVGVHAARGALSAAMVESLVDVGLYTFDRFHPAIVRVAYDGASPEQALEELEERE
ncbi:MAG TPA: YbjN domain-containing protein [Gemmatimonadaceae bacterium]|nr:YbjN domain-containing protein [Gemmatimonadaceae bacterium]